MASVGQIALQMEPEAEEDEVEDLGLPFDAGAELGRREVCSPAYPVQEHMTE